MNKRNQLLMLAVLIALCVGGAVAQGSTFSDTSVEYSFALPEDKWTMIVRPSVTNANVEYVYGDRRDGYLTIRKIAVPKDAVLSEVIQDEAAQSVQFRPGYVANRDENFSGKYHGTIFNFEYVAASKPMVGRYYFLRVDPTTVYVLRFTGLRDSMRSLRSQTDSISRTFSVK